MRPAFDPKRFEDLVLYIAHQTAEDTDFGRLKLAKVLFYSDFAVYRDQGESMSGASYKRMPFGPFPRELEDAEEALSTQGRVFLDYDKDEGEVRKIIPLAPEPDIYRLLEGWQVIVLRDWIVRISSASSKEVSDLSHKHAGWRLAGQTGDDIPFSTALLPEERPTPQDVEEAKQIARDHGWLAERGWIWEREPA
jgi:hypothetical protein